jgi:hypothetical protein
MDPLSQGLIAGVGAFVLMCMVAYLVSWDVSSPRYAGDANGPLFAVWRAGLGVGVALLAFRQWVWGAAWLAGTVAAIVGIGGPGRDRCVAEIRRSC